VSQAFRALIVGHELHQARIKTLKCIIDERVSIDGGQTWNDLATWTMWKSGGRERVHSTMHQILNPNRTFRVVEVPTGERDVLFGPDGIRSMDSYDPAYPPEEPESTNPTSESMKIRRGVIRHALGLAQYKLISLHDPDHDSDDNR
jgi:hypothetical protein